MNSLVSLISIGDYNNQSSLWIEFFRTSPAWIALLISFVLPFITKKLEIEKMHRQFIFEEKYKIYSMHFSKLYKFNNILQRFLVIIDKTLNAQATANDILEAKQDLNSAWNDIKDSEARLWILAPDDILELRKQLLILMKELRTKINSLENDKGFEFTNLDLNELIVIAKQIQVPFSQYLDYYRKEIGKTFGDIEKSA